MKRFFSVALIAVILCGLFAPAYAAEDERQADVYVNAIRTGEGINEAPVENGTAVVTTDDGVVVTATQAPDGAVRLVVFQVPESEKEAWEWIRDCLGEDRTPVHGFEIYFEDADGNRIAADGPEITIECTHCDGTPSVCSLAADGTVRDLTDTADGSTVTFTTDGSGYYVLAGESGSEEPDTGDDILIWQSMLFGSMLLLLLLTARKRKGETA